MRSWRRQIHGFARLRPRHMRTHFGYQGFEVLEARCCLAYTAELVADINPEPQSSFFDVAVAWNDRMYFGLNSVAFWASDGTNSGTVKLADVQVSPQQSPSIAAAFPVASGGNLFFTARDRAAPFHGAELWKTDGSPEGTSIVKDINPNGDSWPNSLTDVNGTLYFTVQGTQLWKSDGTPGGTNLVATPVQGLPNPQGVLNLTNVNGLLFFTSQGNLWRSDGTANGTSLVKDIRANNSDGVANLINVDGTLYFTADDGLTGVEIWKSDGTTDGTVRVKDIAPGTTGSNARNLFGFNGDVYFAATEDNQSVQLWRSDGTEDGTVPVYSFEAPPFLSQFPLPLAVVNGALLFNAYQSAIGTELWRSDGTTQGTQLIEDINPGTGSSGSSRFIEFEGNLYFSAQNGADGFELWRTDGTSAGTVLVYDLYPGATPSFPTWFGVISDQLLFTARDPAFGTELWRSDGTAAGTMLAVDISPGGASSNPFRPIAFDEALYFAATDLAHGTELWRSDGTAEGTFLFNDTENASGDPLRLTISGDLLYFLTSNRKIWATNGTLAGTDYIFPKQPNSSSASATSLTASSNKLFFAGSESASGLTTLWASDGSRDGTVEVKPMGAQVSVFGAMSDVNGIVYFAGSTPGPPNIELWRTDGTPEGTFLVADLLSSGVGSSPANLTNVNGTLYFNASRTVGDRELYKSDGTTNGTLLVRDLDPAASSNPQNFVGAGGYTFLTANTTQYGEGLWRTDGTAEGTVFLARLGPFSTASIGRTIVDIDGVVYFQGDDLALGRSLWRSDGTAEGTYLVKDFWPDDVGGSLGNMIRFEGQLYFSVNDSVHGQELWRSDGTPQGTELVADVWPGPSSASPGSFEILNGQLYFAATTLETGRELWRLAGFANTPDVTSAITLAGLQSQAGLVITRNAADSSEVSHLKVTNIVNGKLFLHDGVTEISNGQFVSFDEAALGFKFTPDEGFVGTASIQVQASTSASDAGLGGDPVTANITVLAGLGTAEDDNLTVRASDDGTILEVFDLNGPMQGEPVFTWPMDATIPLPIDTLAGNDVINIELPEGTSGPAAGIRIDAGSGANALFILGGSANVDAVATGGSLDIVVAGGAEMWTNRFDGVTLTLIDAGAKVTIIPSGTFPSVLTALAIADGATLDVTDNAVVIAYTGTSPAATIRDKILSGRGGAGVGKGWNGSGITSSTAAQGNSGNPESQSVGYAENAFLPLGAFSSFRGVPVDDTSVLIAYTRTGDANLDGVVNDDDVTILGANYAPGVPKPAWALGDFDYNGFVDDDDVTLLGAFYNPGAAALTLPSPRGRGVSAAPLVKDGAEAAVSGELVRFGAVAAVSDEGQSTKYEVYGTKIIARTTGAAKEILGGDLVWRRETGAEQDTVRGRETGAQQAMVRGRSATADAHNQQATRAQRSHVFSRADASSADHEQLIDLLAEAVVGNRLRPEDRTIRARCEIVRQVELWA